MTQVDQIVYAKWDHTSLWYLAQVISIGEKGYNLLFMDGYSKDGVPEKKVRQVPTRERKNKLIGERFFDVGDGYKPTDFKRGEFVVLCYQPGWGGKGPSYWCERETGGVHGKRDIQSFSCDHVMKLVKKYQNE